MSKAIPHMPEKNTHKPYKRMDICPFLFSQQDNSGDFRGINTYPVKASLPFFCQEKPRYYTEIKFILHRML